MHRSSRVPRWGAMPDLRDLALRRAAMDQVRELSRNYDDIVPVGALRAGFVHDRRRWSYGSFYSGIFRPTGFAGPAALSLVTAPPKIGRDAPYEDGIDERSGRFIYHYRAARQPTLAARAAAQRDNRALKAAADLAVPLIYFHGIAPGMYTPVAPVFVTQDDPDRRVVFLEAALPVQDTTDAGLRSDAELRRYATQQVRVRLHQHRFRAVVLAAYRGRCAVCSLREASLLQAAHIIEDRDRAGAAVVVNGIALCAIHHLAYDRNVMGIDPSGVVHIASRLLREIDGPMLSAGLQAFHGESIEVPRQRVQRPDPERLEVRYERFKAAG
jgi:putative restriction endonuclease